MFSVVLVLHLIIAMAMIALILVQQSEGGGLGSSGGGMGSFMSPRGTANLLTRTTGILAVCFMVTSLTLVVLSGTATKHGSVVDQLEQQSTEPTVPTGGLPLPPAAFSPPLKNAPIAKHDNAATEAPAVPVGKKNKP